MGGCSRTTAKPQNAKESNGDLIVNSVFVGLSPGGIIIPSIHANIPLISSNTTHGLSCEYPVGKSRQRNKSGSGCADHDQRRDHRKERHVVFFPKQKKYPH